MNRIAGVFASPEKDSSGKLLLKKWYDAGARLFIGWASTNNTAGKNPTQDRQAQLAWRAAVRALGTDARYVDYPLPDWRTTPTSQDLDLMAADSACAGIYLPDEPNQKVLNPSTQKWDMWRFSIPTLQQYLAPLTAHPVLSTKLFVMNLDGTQITAAWGAYMGDDIAAVLDACPKITHVLTDWHPRNNNPTRYGDDLPGKAVRVVGRLTPSRNMRRGAILECAFEQLPNTVGGRGPTGPEIWAQYQGVVAEDATASPVEIVAFFPEAPKPNAGHIFDNTTDEQFAMCSKIMRDFAPTPVLTAPPATELPMESKIELLAAILDQADSTIQAQAAQITTLQDQNKELHERVSVLESRKYIVTVSQ
jgi:hypothetical protein